MFMSKKRAIHVNILAISSTSGQHIKKGTTFHWSLGLISYVLLLNRLKEDQRYFIVFFPLGYLSGLIVLGCIFHFCSFCCSETEMCDPNSFWSHFKDFFILTHQVDCKRGQHHFFHTIYVDLIPIIIS